MAQYNVGDRVRVYIPGAMVLARICQVTEIVEDNGLGESRYRVLWTSANGLTTRYTPTDRHMNLVARAAEVAPPAPVNPVEPAPAPEEQPGQLVGALDWFNMHNPGPTNEEVEAAAQANIENYRLVGQLPVEFVVVNRRAIPVYDSVQNRGSIQREDYRPTHRSDRLFRFVIGGATLVPRYNVAFGTMDFTCVETGDIWTNTFENAAVTNVDNKIVDHIGIFWTTRREIMEHRRNGQPIPIPRDAANNAKRPKKKLRRKYKEMPKIREEKYYATKEYIA